MSQPKTVRVRVAVRERPILMSAPMVRAILDGKKTQTRRVLKFDAESFSDPVAAYGEGDIGFGAYVFEDEYPDEALIFLPCPYGQPGDMLWVREAFTYSERRESDAVLNPGESRDYMAGAGFAKLLERLTHEGEDYIKYLADGATHSLAEWTHPHPIYDHCVGRFGRTIPGIFMPRWASRLTLRVTGVRVERLQELSEEDALAEGVCADHFDPGDSNTFRGSEVVLADSCRDFFVATWNSINGKRVPWKSNPFVWVISFERIQSDPGGGAGATAHASASSPVQPATLEGEVTA